ncbi:MAG: Re/Si-specific NAD(P)(+) transhydrogenase subunit alpha [Calditrichaceae bacterium]|nr:Re/Si-specific NAD(P)(+) transhydrogenase subunit alpha [Calditrichaceae bacterium]MBN2707789.1 Re/Si-specific NAD(P)(+) transhydrogenase subunit alpha [Calditrichaceae bacterium]RQV96285.1 MAG: Re/Si-specific NAD(P)(+) transhydrogenase subunit alpha [Calditrichota bacterium]
MIIGIPKEIYPGETRAAITPALVSTLIKNHHKVLIEKGLGDGAFFQDDYYRENGAEIIADAVDIYYQAEVIFKVQPPAINAKLKKSEAELIKEGAAWMGFLAPLQNKDAIKILMQRNILSFAMEFVPRITRAQSMDALSSMASLAGYKAVLLAADHLHKIFPLMMTAAGTIPPATVLVLGAGVAGLQAIATAKRLGANVEAFDPRPAVKEQVKSLGAGFVEMELPGENVETDGGYAKEQSEAFLLKEREVIASRLSKADVIITTAQVFGKKAPLLITEEMIKLMHPGSVIIDLAAEQGGNCTLTKADTVVDKHGVFIHGAVNLPAKLPVNASQMYAKNIVNLFLHIFQKPEPDFEDEITRGSCITHSGKVLNNLVLSAMKEEGK